MARIGEAVHEIVADRPQHLDDVICHADRRDRQIARGEPLRHRHQTGLETELLEPEPPAAPAAAADHAVAGPPDTDFARSEARGVGKEWGSVWRSRCWPDR